jgi:hypothetical protein
VPQRSKQDQDRRHGTTSLQVVEKGRLVHTIVAVVLLNVRQTIVG